MRAMNEICPIGEVVAMAGLSTTVTDADRAVLQMLKDDVEDDCRQFCGHGISQPKADYIEYHPKTDRNRIGDPFVDLVGTQVTIRRAAHKGEFITLNNGYVRSITELREDPDAWHEQESDDFGASTVLTEGTDFALVVDERDASDVTLSICGKVERIGAPWPSKAGTIKVTYDAGFTAAELDAQYRWVKGVVREETLFRFKLAKSSQGTDPGAGPVESFSIGGQVTVKYATKAVEQAVTRELQGSTRRKLNKIRRLPLWS